MKYKNIAISSLPGGGKTTLAKALSKKLGWKYFGGGDFMRSYAIEKGLFDPETGVHHDATVYDEDFDRQVDYKMRKTVQETEGNVIESWIAGFMTQKVEGTLKVLAYCSNDDVRVDRLMNRDGISVEEAKKHIFEREKKNTTKWARMYTKEWQDWVIPNHPELIGKDIYFWYPEIFDLTIDTYKFGPKETVEEVIKKLGE